jgi:hypothetical protein
MVLQRPIPEIDPFTNCISNVLVGIYHRMVGRFLASGRRVDDTGHVSYSNEKITRVSGIITVTIASLFPVLTIYVLNLLSSTNARIGVAAAFTALFSFLVATFSAAKKFELFAATAT